MNTHTHRPRPVPLLLLLTALLAGGAAAEDQDLSITVSNLAVRVDGVAAYVNEQPIMISDALIMLEPARRQLVRTYDGQELERRLQAAYREALDTLVERRLILDAYERGTGRIPEWAIDQRAEEVMRDSFGGDRSRLMEALAREQMTYEEWRDTLRDHMIVQAMRSANVDQAVAVPPGDVHAYYLAHTNDFLRPPRVKLRMIVLTPGPEQDAAATRRLADDLARRARTGEEFGVLAARYSTGTHAREGGDWGWIDPARELRGELATVAAAMQPGQVSDPVEVGDYTYVLALEGRRQADVAPLAEVQAEIQDQLRRAAAETAYRDWVDRLRRDAYVRILQPDLF